MDPEVPGDASTLIYLAKSDSFHLAARCVERILVPPAVWSETVEAGERVGAPEVPRILAAGGFLERRDLAESDVRLAAAIAAEHRLGRGESEVLALGRTTGRVIVDEGRATRVARARGITPVSTLFLPVLGIRAGDLDEDDALRFLRRLATVTGVRADVALALENEIRKGRR
jgi:predicted nucleic acid-binding protein